MALTVAEAEQQLAERLLRREVVVFAGAGTSMEADPPLPDWKALVAGLVADLPGGASATADDLDLAQWYVEEHGRGRLEARLSATFGGLDRRPSPLQQALAALPVGLYFTTNYDQLLERALRDARGELPDTAVDDRHVALINDLTATTVVKMHGCASLPDTMVLTREDYERYADHHRAIITYLQTQLATRTLFFAGFSFADPNFRVIHEAIRRTLGQYHRRAYALSDRPLHPLFVRHWARRGIDFVALDGGAGVTAFAQRLAARVGDAVTRGTSLPQFLLTLGQRRPPPLFQAAVRIERQLADVREAIRALLREASEHEGLRLDARLPEGVDDAEAVAAATLEKVRALFGLAEGLERMGYALPADDWLRLGNALYRHGEWPLAARAYTAALRHAPAGRRHRWAEGNLARTYLALGQDRRAEAVLRSLCLTETPAGAALDATWLAERPHDLSELGYAVNRLAERLRADGRPEQALTLLAEVRPWLRQGLHAPWGDGLHGPDVGPFRREAGRRAWGNKALLRNFLGKNYRLAYEMHIALGDRAEAERCRGRAVHHFVRATQEAPLFPYPWSHLLDLYEANLLGRRTAAEHLRLNVRLLDALPSRFGAVGTRVRDSIKARHEDTWARYGTRALSGGAGRAEEGS
ncbi:MAG: SIR2 family protein [Chloroflexota bacterium]|nr:SIR2 family protein [Chloroflexota bacterium]